MAAALRAVEFYSGIGGMHYALKSCAVDVKVIAAIDINTTANEVYAYNYPDTTLLNRNIEGIKLEEFIKFNADIFTMSPPCQPFTRQGNQKASDDPRTKSFLHILKIIRSLTKPPSYILMENVKGFEVSQTRDEFIRTLRETDYCFQEFLLSPSQFGVPNSRLRYFLIAVRNPSQLPFPRTESIMHNLPTTLNTNSRACSVLSSNNPRSHCSVCNKQTSEQSQAQLNETTDNTKDHLTIITNCDEMLDKMKTIQDYLDEESENSKDFLLPEKILQNKVLLMDIVEKKCNHSCCFTKGYGHYVEGTGSVLQTSSIESSAIFEKYNEENGEEKIKLLAPLGLRYFAPKEIANILCFPKHFEFPETVTTKQKYRLLGNSLNVLVVAELMKILFTSENK